jgi:hypothetical protein
LKWVANFNGYQSHTLTATNTYLILNNLQVPLIVRGDLVGENGVLAFDVEKITLNRTFRGEKHEVLAETVAVVNEDKDLVFWAFLKWPKERICQIFPSITGLSREKLDLGINRKKLEEGKSQYVPEERQAAVVVN